MIKTINLKANEETQINLTGGTHVKIKNLGDNTVYVSKHIDIVPSADGVKSIQGNTTDILVDVATYSSKENIFDYYGTIYALAESDCSIELETTNNANFSCKARGGDSETITALQTTVDSLTIQKLENAEDSYSASYQFYKNEVAIGDKINIPKDLVVQSGSVKECTVADTPVTGYVVGDKYIDLLIANSNDGHIYISVSDLVEGVGEYYFVSGIKKGEIFNDYVNNVASGAYSHAEGTNTIASATHSHAEGFGTKASGTGSHAEGAITIAISTYSHAEGQGSVAFGNTSHAEGGGTVAKGAYSHAEGYCSTRHTTTKDNDGNISDITSGHMAVGDYSHVEGYDNIATAESSHAEGHKTQAHGIGSHAGGIGTIASGEAQTAIGKYNVEDTENKYAFIIGNGNSSTRSNVFSLSWDGSLVVDNIKSTLDTTLVEGLKYQIGELTEDITITLPESANSDIEVNFSVGDTTHNITCNCLSLNVVNNTYYSILFSYDKTLNMWFPSILSFDYIPRVTEETSDSEVDTNDGTTT